MRQRLEAEHEDARDSLGAHTLVRAQDGLDLLVRQRAQVEAIGESSVEADMLEWLLI